MTKKNVQGKPKKGDREITAADIKKYRQSRGWSQEQLASELSLSRSTIALWETGRSQPTKSTQKLLRLTFGLN